MLAFDAVFAMMKRSTLAGLLIEQAQPGSQRINGTTIAAEE
jgi:hypothetical protein